MTKYQLILESSLETLLKTLIKDQEPFSVIVPSHLKWDKPLDIKEPTMRLDLKGWSLEQTTFTDRLNVITAFGKIENSRRFNVSEIYGILDKDSKPLFSRVFESAKREYTIKGLMNEFNK